LRRLFFSLRLSHKLIPSETLEKEEWKQALSITHQKKNILENTSRSCYTKEQKRCVNAITGKKKMFGSKKKKKKKNGQQHASSHKRFARLAIQEEGVSKSLLQTLVGDVYLHPASLCALVRHYLPQHTADSHINCLSIMGCSSDR